MSMPVLVLKLWQTVYQEFPIMAVVYTDPDPHYDTGPAFWDLDCADFLGPLGTVRGPCSRCSSPVL